MKPLQNWVWIQTNEDDIPLGLRKIAAKDLDSGEFYVPVILAGDEFDIILSALGDGIYLFQSQDRHFYAPLSWMRRKYADNSELVDALDEIATVLADIKPRLN